MLRKRTKKYFPPGTFIPMPARVAAIIQLCLAFTLILWHASLPFMGNLFAVKSEMLVYQHVIGFKDKANAELFAKLPDGKRSEILQDYDRLQKQLEIPFRIKLKQSVQTVLLDIPALELAWLFFSIAISLLLLLKIEGAVQAVWLLPLLAGAYALDNRMYGQPKSLSGEVLLFPSEQLIVDKYLDSPLSADIFQQQSQLKKGWEHYLIEEWAPKAPVPNDPESLGQAQRGEFAFNAARLDILHRDRKAGIKPAAQQLESPWLLSLYIFWNLSFASITYLALLDKDINGDAGEIANEGG